MRRCVHGAKDWARWPKYVGDLALRVEVSTPQFENHEGERQRFGAPSRTTLVSCLGPGSAFQPRGLAAHVLLSAVSSFLRPNT